MAAQALKNLGHEIDGVILNDIKSEETGYYGYGYYRRYYGGYYKREGAES